MTRSIAAASALGIAVLFAAPHASACSCLRPDSHEAQVRADYEGSSVVFSGYVRDVGDADANGKRIARLRVLQVWKGELQPATWVEAVASDNGGADCGYSAQPDTALMVYAAGEPPYVLGMCTLTGPLDGATVDIPQLNALAGTKAPHE